MDPTSTVWIHEHADLDAIHTTCRPGMEATVEQEFGNLPERAVQTQLRQEHDVRARVSAQESHTPHDSGPHQTAVGVDLPQALADLLKALPRLQERDAQAIVVIRQAPHVLLDE